MSENSIINEWQSVMPKESKVTKLIRPKEKTWMVTEIKGVFQGYDYSDMAVSPQFNQFINMESKLVLTNNHIPIPYELTAKLGWNEGDELYADIFDETLMQIVVGKKLSGEDSIKGLDKITSILNE